LVVALAGCAADEASTTPSTGLATTSATTPISRSTTAPSLDPAGCPVPDEVFCATATDAASAVARGDARQLLALSRSDTIRCADVAQEYFPGCATDDVLEGHGLSDAGFIVELVSEPAYLDALERITAGGADSFVDEIGDGEMQVIGVGTCGPDDPSRRTYHLAFTTALGAAGGTEERVVGSFEFGFRDGQWRIVLMYLDTLERWEAEQADPFREAFCAAGRSPWT
jgi:hypothetical protein